MSQVGWLPLPSTMAVDGSSATRLCLPASLLAEWTAASQRRQSAASSAQHSTAASARPHASHPIFMSARWCWWPAGGGWTEEAAGENLITWSSCCSIVLCRWKIKLVLKISPLWPYVCPTLSGTRFAPVPWGHRVVSTVVHVYGCLFFFFFFFKDSFFFFSPIPFLFTTAWIWSRRLPLWIVMYECGSISQGEEKIATVSVEVWMNCVFFFVICLTGWCCT